MEIRYPLAAYDERSIPADYDGPVCVWDVDKTYLSTHFSSLRGLSRIPIEFAVDKVAIAGMPEVLRGLRRGPGKGYRCVPLYFITASPPQLRKVLERRMLLDGVEYDGITFKDWLGILRQRQPRRFVDQLGYKVCALLVGRRGRPMATEFLFGDDTEHDADAFALYAKLMHRELSAGEAAAAMMEAGMRKENRQCAFGLLDRLPSRRGKVRRFFIHLERGTPPSAFERFGELAVPVRNGFQLALALLREGLVDEDTVRLARGAVAGSTDAEADLADAVARGLVRADQAGSLLS